ncbi:MAG: aminoglycoside phosphotransferase family protein [Alphaproteobacteria bacterium]|nr:aminoglycoside phosphotransferase family protein [Alphaproteobacteria bacterium]
MINLDVLHARLVAFEGLRDLVRGDLHPMAVRGIVHDHIRLAGLGVVARVPRFNVWGMTPGQGLAYQATCFQRAWPSGHVPKLLGVLEPSPDLPFGALLVEEIRGHPPRLPDDFDAIARALARIHREIVPPETERLPLVYHRDPVAGTLERIETQAEALDRAAIDARARAALDEELDWARRFAIEVRGLEQPSCLVMTDTHPGNFIIAPEGKAVLVDLEKGMYGSPAIDLAHASLYTSIMWDPQCAADIGLADAARLYRAYLGEIDRPAAEAIRPWFQPMRRLTWLRTTTWAAGWLAGRALPEDVPDRLVRWIDGRLKDYFDPATIARIRHEWLGEDELAAYL